MPSKDDSVTLLKAQIDAHFGELEKNENLARTLPLKTSLKEFLDDAKSFLVQAVQGCEQLDFTWFHKHLNTESSPIASAKSAPKVINGEKYIFRNWG